MIIRILDSDILTLLFEGDANIVGKIKEFKQGELGLSIITVDEDLVGWHTELHKRHNKKPAKQAQIWEKYAKSTKIYRLFEIYAYSEKAMETYQILSSAGYNIGGNDLRIASIALELGATIVTRNLQHFERIPNIKIDRWPSTH